MDIIELPLEFIGIGEVKGDLFKQRNRSPKAYIYERKASDSDYTIYEREIKFRNQKSAFTLAKDLMSRRIVNPPIFGLCKNCRK